MDSTIDLIPEDSDLMPIMLFDTQAPLESLVQQAYSARPELRESQALIAAANAQRKGVTYGPIIPTLSTSMFFGSLNGGWDRYWGERAVDTIRLTPTGITETRTESHSPQHTAVSGRPKRRRYTGHPFRCQLANRPRWSRGCWRYSRRQRPTEYRAAQRSENAG